MGTFLGDDDDNDIDGTGGSDVIKGGGGHDYIHGLAGDDKIYGQDGNDILWGDTGGDDMHGGLGHDWYEVDSLLDKVTEIAGEGHDTVYSSITYTLPNNVEDLQLANSGGAINGFGNVLDNVIMGNKSANVLKGGAGDDTFSIVHPGDSGADTMYGGADDDIYYVDSMQDVVVEYANEGLDRVRSYVSYTLSANVERLQLLEYAGAITGTGNSLDNRIWGNAFDNVLSGGFGQDELFGFAGNDVLIGGAGADHIVGGIGIDTLSYQSSTSAVLVNLGNGMTQGGDAAGDTFDNATIDNLTGSIYNDALFGSGLANVLNGGGGDDALFGGLNNDVFVFDPSIGGWFGHDTVLDFVKGEDKLQLDDAQFADFAAVQAAMSQVGADTVITYDAANSITLQNVSAASLAAGDVLFI